MMIGRYEAAIMVAVLAEIDRQETSYGNPKAIGEWMNILYRDTVTLTDVPEDFEKQVARLIAHGFRALADLNKTTGRFLTTPGAAYGEEPSGWCRECGSIRRDPHSHE